MEWKVVKGSEDEAKRFAELLRGNATFLFVIGNTKTAEIPGITVAGANPDLIKYTPPADVELLHYGYCRIIPAIPATPDGKPTPALITYTALRLTKIPFFVVDSGLMVKPMIPYVSIGAPVGNNIERESAMNVEDVKEAFNRAVKLGEQFSVALNDPTGLKRTQKVLRACRNHGGLRPAPKVEPRLSPRACPRALPH
jgi:NaMN:DMB phosphoribosyltransferase